MEDAFRFADELGPKRIATIYDPGSGLRAVVVVDNVARGPSIGGVRMAPDVSVEECFRLARAMTFKNAAAGLPCGGGKAVIFADPSVAPEKKEALIRAFAHAIEPLVDYIPGPDMGTDERCMAWVHDEIGRSVGLPRSLGGIPLDEIGATGWGLRAATRAAMQFVDFDLEGARVVVQGFGAVGTHAARFLRDEGARIVAVADSKGGIHDPDGLNVDALLSFKRSGSSVTRFDRGERVTAEELVGLDCDIWIPAARPDAITADNVDRLQARLIVPGANIGVTDQAEKILHDRGVVTLPDFIANAGGVICAFVEFQGGTAEQAFAAIEEKVHANTRDTLGRAAERDVRPRVAAQELARDRVEDAMELRRRF